MIRVAIVDDEPPARRKLHRLLANEPDFSIVGEATSGAEAVCLLNRLQPDLVFLDIGLPDCTGFEVVETVEQRDRLQIIFVTAFDEFALKAFEHHALDYVLKPVEPSRFTAALERARRMIESGRSGEVASRLEELVRSLRADAAYAARLLIQEDGRSLFLDVRRIDWLEAARNYVCVHAGVETYIVRATLETMAGKLDPAKFRRINRSKIVNLNSIAELRSWFHGDQKIVLKSGAELTWSRRYRPDSLEELEKA
ncbi:MAG: response regulator transcription factor [Acidobacteriaceae bacterium]|nr:response regulator transcription factor [Acidobacteriaceae bacterium]MBV9499716.1 response regulator transcription factor [Acidobacteriaceae bacterium]